jgi:hypothetical protein
VQCPGIAYAKRGRGRHSERSPAACASLCCGAQRGISCRSMGRRSFASLRMTCRFTYALVRQHTEGHPSDPEVPQG